MNLTEKQQFRTIKYQDKNSSSIPYEMLIPLDKIGHNEIISLKIPSYNNIIKINL